MKCHGLKPIVSADKSNEVFIKTINKEDHRYSTVGDYWRDQNGQLQIRVSKLNNKYMEFLVILHELCEVYFTEYKRIKEEDIKAFDEEFESKRVKGNTDEPGNDPKAPYLEQHVLAEAIERIAATYLGINWIEYSNTIDKLS